jgi:hypothetical protein
MKLDQNWKFVRCLRFPRQWQRTLWSHEMSDRNLLTFQRNELTPYSGSKNKHSLMAFFSIFLTCRWNHTFLHNLLVEYSKPPLNLVLPGPANLNLNQSKSFLHRNLKSDVLIQNFRVNKFSEVKIKVHDPLRAMDFYIPGWCKQVQRSPLHREVNIKITFIFMPFWFMCS